MNVMDRIKSKLMKKKKTHEMSFVSVPAGSSTELGEVIDIMVAPENSRPLANLMNSNEAITLTIMEAGSECKKTDKCDTFVSKFIKGFEVRSSAIESIRSKQITDIAGGFFKKEAMMERERLKAEGKGTELEGIVD